MRPMNSRNKGDALLTQLSEMQLYVQGSIEYNPKIMAKATLYINGFGCVSHLLALCCFHLVVV